jgi:hypothetical protein
MTEPPDEIADDEELYRRLAPGHVDSDGAVNSAAFKVRGRPDLHISVDLARLTMPDAALARAPRPGFGLGVLVARVPRSLGFSVRRDPLPDNAAHALIEGDNDKAKCRLLARATRVLIPPKPDV